MRLDMLKIPNYKKLRNLTIDFDEEQKTTVLLGRNGSGKSYLFEAIVEIFKGLDSDSPKAPFDYRLSYLCNDHSIKINTALPKSVGRMEIRIDEERVSLKDFAANRDEYLPRYIFAYYSGWSSRLEQQFEDPTRRFYGDARESKTPDLPLRRFFFCRKEYAQLVLLAFFLAREQSDEKQILRTYLGIESFESALIAMHQPWWGSKKKPTNKRLLEEGDKRFWYARGAFREFLSRLWSTALAPFKAPDEPVPGDIRKQQSKSDLVYLFIKDKGALMTLKHAKEDTKTLFGYFESLFLCDLIEEVRVKVRKTSGEVVTFSALSEGEQQLLTVLGLLLFTQNDESLYLLDEPDTHLNPVWTYEYLKLLEAHMVADKGQLIVATHNPLMIGSLSSEEVRLIHDGKEKTLAVEPEISPSTLGIEGLLKSEIYGLRSTLSTEVLEKLDDYYALVGKKKLSHKEREELERVREALSRMRVSYTHPNPYFESFAAALSRRIPTDQLSFTKQQIEEQAHLADKLIAEILAEETNER